MKYITTISLFLFLIFSAFAEDFLNVDIVRVYDGDTFFVDIADIPAVFGDDIGIRVRGIDTPEIRGKCDQEKHLAYKSRDFVIRVLENATVVDLMDVKRGKYFRVLADVLADGILLSTLLINEGLAVVYNGGKKHSWC